jgi:hypothetical protein
MKYITILLLLCGMVFGLGGQILDGADPYEIATPFDETDVAALQWAATDNQLYLVSGNDVPQVLTRTTDTSWTIADVDFQTGPFLPENDGRYCYVSR